MKKKYSVLCVDDEENVLRSLQRSLMYEDFETFYAKDAESALALMEKKEIAIVIADMKMPEKDGLTFLKEVRNNWPLTVRIVISGYLQVPQIIAAINTAGIHKFIPKPWRVQEDLISAIYDALEQYKLAEETEHFKALLRTRNNTYQNIIRRVNENIEATKHGTSLMGIVGKTIFNELGNIVDEKINHENLKDILFKVAALFEDVSMLSSLEFTTMEVEDVMEKIASALRTFESIKRVDLDRKKYIDNKVRVKDGLIEYAICNLIDNMLPGIYKYVKIFLQENEEEKSDCVSFFIIVSPIHREQSENDGMKVVVQPIFKAFIKALMESFDGYFEIVNKGTRYLLKIEIPGYVPPNIKNG